MSQHDFNIANQGFPATRSDINNALAALASTSSGTSEPSTTYANQFWYDTTNNLLKFRNEADSAWITLAYLDQGTNEWEIRSAVIQAVDSAGVIIKTDDGTARVTVADDGDVTFANDVTVNGNLDVSSGTIKLSGNYPTGSNNVSLGDESFQNLSTGNNNTAVGRASLFANTSGGANTAIGSSALESNTTASNNTAVGYQAGYSKTTGDPITAVGYQALTSVTTGAYSTAVGRNAGDSITTGNHNTLMGNFTGADITTGASNTALGSEALRSNTTASNNTAFGYQAGYSTTTGQYNLFVGSFAGYNSTGTGNTFVGAQTAGYGCGDQMTTGSKNTILGAYNGNEGGLDIRTSSNNIVLSDGDGNPLLHMQGSYFRNDAIYGIKAFGTTRTNSSYTIPVDGNGAVYIVAGYGHDQAPSAYSRYEIVFLSWNSTSSTAVSVYSYGGNGDIIFSVPSYGSILVNMNKSSTAGTGDYGTLEFVQVLGANPFS